MKTLYLLEDSDVIEATDFVRPLKLEYIGQSDVLLFKNMYGGGPTNHLQWLEVSRAHMDFFIGKTVGEFNAATDRMEKQHQPLARHEFVRGPIHPDHILPETDAEAYVNRHSKFVMPCGKYVGTLARDVIRSDESYFYWAADKGIIPDDVFVSIRENY